MTAKRTFYDVLGVRPGATQREIRAAYLRLIKENHPDLAIGRGAAGNPHVIPLINQSYGMLRDARRRAAYDAALASQHRPAGLRRIHYSPAAKRPRHLSAKVALLLVVAAIVACLGAGPAELASALSRATHLKWATPGHAPAAARINALPSAAAIRHEVHLARTLSLRAAIGRSERCFEAARRTGRVDGAELCIVFDEALRYWRKSQSGFPTLPVYFEDDLVQLRHGGALSVLGFEAQNRVRLLRQAAFRALLKDVGESALVEDGPVTQAAGADPRAFADAQESAIVTAGGRNTYAGEITIE